MKLDFKYTTSLVNDLIKIEKYKTALDYLFLPTRVKQQMMYDAKLKKTHFSTSIEGNVLSYNQVENVIKNKNDIHRLSAEQEVQNYWDALTFLESCAKEKRELDLNLVFELHDIIEKRGVIKRIEYREPTPPGVLFAVYDSKTRMPEYIPPESKDVPFLMNELIEWYNSQNNLPITIIAAIMNYAFVSIHPFSDGNGRTSRALATYVLMLNNYDFKGFNSFEEYYMSDLDGYYSSLQMGLPILFYDGRENPPHLEIWIEYFVKVMALNAENIYNQALEASKKDSINILSSLSKKDLTLLRYCIENKKVKIKPIEIATLFNVTPRAINKWSIEWVEKGILIPCSGKKRITQYQLSDKYINLKISSLGFTD